MTQDKFEFHPYPFKAGAKTQTGPSQQAAQELNKRGRPESLRDKVIASLELYGALTPDECADRLGESLLSIRPRFSELSRMGRILKTGNTRPSSQGKSQAVWRVA
tara:strand:+ start:378 stop:692 length:315 start_codon:yes stop_codon:yes gene_type:complete